jgi:hypothetical protein
MLTTRPVQCKGDNVKFKTSRKIESLDAFLCLRRVTLSKNCVFVCVCVCRRVVYLWVGGGVGRGGEDLFILGLDTR